MHMEAKSLELHLSTGTSSTQSRPVLNHPSNNIGPGIPYIMSDWTEDAQLRMNTSFKFARFVDSVHALYPNDMEERRAGDCIIWYTIGDGSKKSPIAMSTSDDYVQFLKHVSADGKCCVCFFTIVSPTLSLISLP